MKTLTNFQDPTETLLTMVVAPVIFKRNTLFYSNTLQKLFEFSSIIAGVQNFCCLGKAGLNAGVYRIPGGDSGYSGRPETRKFNIYIFKKKIIFNFALYCKRLTLHFF
jgi:hypothetical protein